MKAIRWLGVKKEGEKERERQRKGEKENGWRVDTNQ